MLPEITDIVNLSLSTGVFPDQNEVGPICICETITQEVNLSEPVQYGYRSGHSTETAL